MLLKGLFVTGIGARILRNASNYFSKLFLHLVNMTKQNIYLCV